MSSPILSCRFWAEYAELHTSMLFLCFELFTHKFGLILREHRQENMVFTCFFIMFLTMKHRRATQVISWFISRNYIFITFIPWFSWEAPWLSLTGGFQSIVASDFPSPRILESSRWRFESHPHTAEKFRGQCLLAAKVTGFVGKGCDKRGTIWLFTIAMEHPWNKWI